MVDIDRNMVEFVQRFIDVSNYSKNFIVSLLNNRMSELNISTTEEYLTFFETNNSEQNALKNKLTNSYSIFFRNRFTYEVLSHFILPQLLKKSTTDNEIRLWSAGCSGGHESYSLGILFETFNDLNSKHIKYRIFATDRSYEMIEKAVVGEYNETELGNITFNEMQKWFVKTDKKYKIDAEIKKSVQFELFDLLDKECICPRSSIFGDFDLIMCANVLIYYNNEVQMHLISNFKKCLSKEGVLVSGEAERELFIQNGFVELIPQSCIFKVNDKVVINFNTEK